MTINLLTVSTAKETDLIVSALLKHAGAKIAKHVHLGSGAADFKASSLSRINAKRGRKGHLFEQDAYSGAAADIMRQPCFESDLALFVEELSRRGDMAAYDTNHLVTLQDHKDYFHILADAAANFLRENEITHFLSFGIPHLAQDTIFYLVARSMGLRCVIMNQSLEPGRFFSMQHPHDFGHVPRFDPEAKPYKIEKGAPLDLFYMAGVGQAKAEPGKLSAKAVGHMLMHVITKEPSTLLKPGKLAGYIKRMRDVARSFPKWRDPFARFFHVNDLAYFEHLAGYEDTEIDLERKFVYFPMQYQPEMTTSSLGGIYVDQALALEHLRDMLPDDVDIYVKENPKQPGFARGPMFFHRLRRIPGLTFLPSYIDTNVLTAKSQFVASVTGTVGWEAIRQGKPALVFGATWYQNLPGVHAYTPDLTFEEIMGTEIDHAQLERMAGSLFARAHDGVINRHFSKIMKDFDGEKNAELTAPTLLDLLTGDAAFSFSRDQS